MTYLIPFHLVAGSDLLKLGPAGLVAASPQPYKPETEVILLPSAVHIYSTFNVFLVCIPYHNLLYVILFHIL